MARGFETSSTGYMEADTPLSGPIVDTESISVGFWIYGHAASVSGIKAICALAGKVLIFQTSVSDGVVYFNTTSGLYNLNFTSYEIGVWHHYLFTYGSSGYHVYRDGHSINQSATPISDPLLPSTGVQIFDSSNPNYDFSLAELGVWNRSLDPTEIHQLSSKQYTPDLIPNGLIGSWRLLGEDSSIEPDSTVYGNNLLSGTTSVPVTTHISDMFISFPTINYAPHIISPSNDDMFNHGKVTIEWHNADPPSSNSTADKGNLTYEIEYTDDYDEEHTVWRTLRRRIPYTDSSYDWIVGKTIKSSNVRIRMRAKNVADESVSDWSISGTFSINVFDLIPPIVVSPAENRIYTDYVLIVWDETPIRDTFHQKIRYTVEYSSESKSIDWTKIAANIPVGQNVIRWNIEDITPANDYVIRLTARNTSTCQSATEETPDQQSVAYVYNIQIQHSGMFLIDTTPPKAKIEIEGNTQNMTSQTHHTLNIYAEDDTTDVETMRIRECDGSNLLPLGNTEDFTDEDLCPLEDIMNIKEIPYSPKVRYSLNADASGFRKIEVLVKDTAGNLSFQEPTRLFLPFFKSLSTITDFIVVIDKDRTKIDMTMEDGYPIVTESSAVYEIMYVATESGDLYILDPFPRLSLELGKKIMKIFMFNEVLYIFTHEVISQGSDLVDSTEVYRHTAIITEAIGPGSSFQKDLQYVAAIDQYKNLMYVGFVSGELWSYNATTYAWSKITTFERAIQSMTSDEKFLYIGFQNSSVIALYNGTDDPYTVETEI